jgi:hypothetical protein
MKSKPKREGLLSVPLDFDEAMRRALKVKPPPEGWAEHERRAKQKRAQETRLKKPAPS